MALGGKRKGAGRPNSGGGNRESTKTVRVPLSFAEKIPELLKKHKEENFHEDFQLPAKVHEEYLPLERLAWEAFEIFCLDFIARFLKPQEIYRYGTQGDDQEGIDIVADLMNGEKWAFQCKQWQRFHKGDAIKVIKQAEGFEADRYILLLSRVAGVEVRKVIADATAWEVWDVQDISRKVRELLIDSPEAARRLVRDHFHPEWQNAFLGISKLTPFISSEDFFLPWLNTGNLFNHAWKLEGRNDSLKSLQDFVTSSEKVAILPGRGGIGKTKLLYEFAKTFDSPFSLWFVEDGISVTPENADRLPLRPCLIVVDDAHRREQDIITLCKLIHNRIRSNHPEIKLVLSSRPYAIQFLQSQLDREEIDYLTLDELKELSRSEMKALAHQAIGQDYAHFADQLAAIAYDSPLVTVVGGQLLVDRAIPLNLLERNEDFRRKVLNRFKEVRLGQISEQIHPEICKKILALLAAAAPIQVINEQFQQVASEFIGVDKTTLIRSLGILEQAGVLLRKGKNLRITPDVLADHILHEACLTEQGESTGYAQEIFEAFREIYPTQVLRNLAELDWRVSFSSGQETNLIENILLNLKEKFKQASNSDRCFLLSLIKEIAYYQPKHSLDIVKFIIHRPTTNPEDKNIPDTYVLSKLPEILHRISYTLDYLPICCDLLWQIGRDDANKTRYDTPESIRVLINLAKYGINKSLKFINWPVLEAIERWLQEPNAHDHIYSPLDILDSFLEKEIEHNDYNGNTVVISNYLLENHDDTKKIRSKALGLIKELLKSNNTKIYLRILKSLEKALKELRDQSGQYTHVLNHRWESEQLDILEIIQSLVTQNTEPIVQLKTIDVLDWYAQHSHSKVVRKKTKNIISSIPKTDNLKLTGVLSNHYDWDGRDESFYNLSWQERDSHRDKTINSLITKFLEKYPSPQEGIRILNERIQSISESGSSISTRFLELLSKQEPNYSLIVCEKILNLGDCPLSPHMASMLFRLRNFDVEQATKIFQTAIDSGISSFCSSFAKSFWAWENNFNAEEFYEIIQKLLNHPDLEVKKASIGSLTTLMQSQPQLAISLALSVELNEDSELAEKLFQIFSNNTIYNSLTESELRIFLEKLELINDLHGYYISDFLVSTSQIISFSVLQLILKRIKISVEKDDSLYEPLPSNYHENFLHNLSKYEEYEEYKEYKDMLRQIRELWFNCQSQVESSRLITFYKELYTEASLICIEKSGRDFTLDVTPASIELLEEWIQTGEDEKIRASAKLISGLNNRLNSDFIFQYLDIVEKLLEQAYQVGDECYEYVFSHLFSSSVYRLRSGVLGKPFPEDIAMRDQASIIANQRFKGSPVHKFFQSLVKEAESRIKSESESYHD
jgi:hypothetical protein